MKRMPAIAYFTEHVDTQVVAVFPVRCWDEAPRMCAFLLVDAAQARDWQFRWRDKVRAKLEEQERELMRRFGARRWLREFQREPDNNGCSPPGWRFDGTTAWNCWKPLCGRAGDA